MLCQTCILINTGCRDNREQCEHYSTTSSNMFEFHTRPYKHQQDALNFLLNKEQAALFMEMGTGKTKVILDLIINARIEKVLIICPLSVIGVWKDEAFKHTPELFNKMSIISDSSHIGSTSIQLVNFEKARNITPSLYYNKYDLIVIDESIKIKNIRAIVTKRLCWLSRNIPKRIIMSGAPTVNNEMDLWSQFLFLDSGQRLGKSLQHFRHEYFDPDPYGFKWFPKKNTHEKIAALIKPITFTLSKKDCLSLPDYVYITRPIEMSSYQATIYEDMKKKFVAQLSENDKDIVSTKWILAQLSYLQSIACGFVHDIHNDEYRPISSNKISALIDILSELAYNKVIVWTRFKYSAEEIYSALKQEKRPYYCLSSDMNEKQREEAIHAFINSTEPVVFVAPTSIGGYGLNLTCASHAIYYSNSFNYSDRIQSEARIHRVGQTCKVTYIDLVTKGTIEEDILQAINRKEDILKSIVNNLKRI